jgi:solute:Na+ symporter, SSS family
MVAAVLAYIVISLLTCREDFNLDRVLHRGQWAVKEYGNEVIDEAAVRAKRSWIQSMLGIDEHFTKADKIQTWVIFGWTMFWFVVFVVFTVLNLWKPWPTAWWATYWHIVGIWFPLAIGLITTIWFTIGGVHDLRILFKRLDEAQKSGPVTGTPVDAEELGGFEKVTPIVISDPESTVK